MGVPATDPLAQLSLPPGFRFYPTDEELLVQYLCKKVAGHQFNLQIIGDIDLYKFDPWDLPSKALFGEKEWYFFTPRDRKYPNGSRPNRVAGSGYWKATGTDKIISTEGKRVGIKKALVFYIGKAPKGTKTNWIMHEYRLIESFRKMGSSKLDDWVLCRIYKKNAGSLKPALSNNSSKEHSIGNSSSSSSFDDMLETFSEIDDRLFSLPRMNSLKTLQLQHHQLPQEEDQKPNFQNTSSVRFGCAGLSGLDVGPSQASQTQGLATYRQNGAYAPGIAPLSNPTTLTGTDDEVQSGLRTGGSSFIHVQGNPIRLSQSPNYPLDPYGYGYPAQTAGFGFRQ
ncbi:hypothetical protein MLD38_000648 [Melastoma candidum]|uniref:Uncharacterized protein n=1 Tax=Melastoma candidum TaxID=119954 RepID=A0ACB9SA23_9MYRT|nr:hypothetical protein MLD38_000648 [Melastoma candidum]